ncbi:MAG: hypothetical protein KKH04_12205 [Proteobacteria bacterium]|nr:hypothetical protein [Pseudomonadota bacterium]
MCESLWKKMIGKPDSGKLNVRFDEGELEIGHSPLRQLSTLPISSDSASKLASPIPNRSTRRYA